MTSARDALLLVQTQLRTRLVERVLTHAATTRLETVAVVDIRNAAWARRACTVVLPCYSGNAAEAESAMAAASMLHLLVRNTAVRIGARACQRQDVVAHMNQEFEGD